MIVKRKNVFGIICISIISVVIIFGAQINPEYMDDDKMTAISNIFHVRLVEPELYENGVYAESFVLEKGVYEFRFTPNGDSPELLTIMLIDDSILFSEDFALKGTPHETDISLITLGIMLGLKKYRSLKTGKLTSK